MSDYDVYHLWLGIPPDQQPPTLYQLLGVACRETDLEVIRSAAERQSSHVRRRARGEFTEIGQDLLNEIAEAKLCLINPARREAYDLTLPKPESGHPQNDAASESVRPGDSQPELTFKGTVEEIVPTSVKATYINIVPIQTEQSTQNSWVIGYHSKCDFRIDSPTISGVHCQITYSRRGLQITDLNSTNGTYINQNRIRAAHTIRRQDLVTLGRDCRILLPGNLMVGGDDSRGAIFVGKGHGNEIQLESPSVSLFHARILPDAETAILEDLQSKNGTYVRRGDAKPLRVQRYRLQPDDIVYFGDTKVSASKILQACGVT